MNSSNRKRVWSSRVQIAGKRIKKKLVRCTSTQIQQLITFMSQNKDMAQTGIRSQDEDIIERWERFAEMSERSAMGPHKTVDQWKTTWRDLKRRAREAIANKGDKIVISLADSTILSILDENWAEKLINKELVIVPDKPTTTAPRPETPPKSEPSQPETAIDRNSRLRTVNLPIYFLPGHPGRSAAAISSSDPLYSNEEFIETSAESPCPSISPPPSVASSHKKQKPFNGMPIWAAAAAEMEQNRLATDHRLANVLETLASSVSHMAKTLDKRLEQLDNTLNSKLTRIVDLMEKKNDHR